MTFSVFARYLNSNMLFHDLGGNVKHVDSLGRAAVNRLLHHPGGQARRFTEHTATGWIHNRHTKLERVRVCVGVRVCGWVCACMCACVGLRRVAAGLSWWRIRCGARMCVCAATSRWT
jgi:hypothetical protein